MLTSLTQLLVFQLLGECITQGLALPIPGPVIGMMLLFASLVLRGELKAELQTTSHQLLKFLTLFFIPAGVGIMVHWHRVSQEWPALLAAVLVSTLASLIVTAWVMKRCSRP